MKSLGEQTLGGSPRKGIWDWVERVELPCLWEPGEVIGLELWGYKHTRVGISL